MINKPPVPIICVLSSCSFEHYAHGLCAGHHQRWYRTGDVQEHIPLVPRVRQEPPPPPPPVLRPLVCACRIDPVRVRLAGHGSVVCLKCERPPMESFGIFWDEARLAAARSDLAVPA